MSLPDNQEKVIVKPTYIARGGTDTEKKKKKVYRS